MTEDRDQLLENRRQMTEDSRRKTDDRGWEIVEFGMWNAEWGSDWKAEGERASKGHGAWSIGIGQMAVTRNHQPATI